MLGASRGRGGVLWVLWVRGQWLRESVERQGALVLLQEFWGPQGFAMGTCMGGGGVLALVGVGCVDGAKAVGMRLQAVPLLRGGVARGRVLWRALLPGAAGVQGLTVVLLRIRHAVKYAGGVWGTDTCQ